MNRSFVDDAFMGLTDFFQRGNLPQPVVSPALASPDPHVVCTSLGRIVRVSVAVANYDPKEPLCDQDCPSRSHCAAVKARETQILL